MLEAFNNLCEDFQKSLQKLREVDQTSSLATKTNAPSKDLDKPSQASSAIESMEVEYGPDLPPRLDSYSSRSEDDSGQVRSSAEDPSKVASTKPKQSSHYSRYQVVDASSASDHYSDYSIDPQPSRPKKHSDKSKHKSRTRFLPSSSEEDQSSEHRHRSRKPSRKSFSDQDHPQHDPDPPYYREVALSDISSQYAEEVDMFRRILKLPDPRESLPRSSTVVMGLDDEKGRQELRTRGSSSMLPLNSVIKDAFDKFDQDFQAANLPEGKYIKPPPSTAKWYKVGQPCFEDKIQELNTDFAKICISPKPSGAPMGKIPMTILKELEHQARQNISTLNFAATFAKTSSSCNVNLERCQHSLKATFKKVKSQIRKGANPETAAKRGYEEDCEYLDLWNKTILIQHRALTCLSKSLAHILQRELYSMGNTGFLRREAEMTLLQPHLGETRRQELRTCLSLFKSQLVKEGEDFLLKKGTSKDSHASDPTRISPLVVPTRKEPPTGNAPMGAIPLKAVTKHFLPTGENKTSEALGVIFDPTIGEEGVETPLPNDSFKASNSPPVGGHHRSFSRDWQANNCSSNVLNIITNGYVLPFLSKPNLVRFPLIISEYEALPKDQALADCIQSLLSKNAIERVENVKSLGFYSRLFLVPKPHQRWRPVIDLSRLNTFLHVEKFKMETPESIRTSLIPGEWVALIDLSDAYLHIPIHPHSRKYLRFCHRSQVFQITSLPFGLATAPQVFTMIVKEVKLMAPFILQLKSKHVLTVRCLMSLIGLLASTEKMVPEGRLHMRPFQFHLKEHWKFPQPLDSLLPWTEAISAHLDWWQNPANVMKGSDLHPKDHSIQLFTDASNKGWGAHLEQSSTPGLWSPQEKGLHIKVLELKAVFLALRHFKDQCQDQTVLVATDNSTVGAYINKQGGTHSAEMGALLWRIMTWCHHSHITLKARHIPGCLNVMADLLSRSNQVQSTEWSLHPQVFKQISQKWFTPHVDLFATHLNHKLPLYVSPIPDPKAWDIDALNIDWTDLTAYAYPPTALLHRAIQKIRQCNCLIILIAPGWPGMP